jgi:single-strand DNA-binding protein
MNLNKVFVLGNVTRNPETKSLPSGQQVANFGIATNRFYSVNGEKKQEAEFHNIVAFGKLADIASQYLNKGSLVLIEGRIKTNSWQNQQGVKQYRTEIVAEALQLGPKGQGGGFSGGNSAGFAKFNRPEPQADQPRQDNSNEIPIIQEDYPASSGPVTFEDGAADEIDIKDIPF